MPRATPASGSEALQGIAHGRLAPVLPRVGFSCSSNQQAPQSPAWSHRPTLALPSTLGQRRPDCPAGWSETQAGRGWVSLSLSELTSPPVTAAHPMQPGHPPSRTGRRQRRRPCFCSCPLTMCPCASLPPPDPGAKHGLRGLCEQPGRLPTQALWSQLSGQKGGLTCPPWALCLGACL